MDHSEIYELATTGQVQRQRASDVRDSAPIRYDSDAVLHENREFRVRLADTQGQRSRASMLINRMYSWRGYDTGSDGREPQVLSQITLVASKHERVFGTLTVGLDDPQRGLQVDQLYKDEIDGLRQQGRTVCEFIRLAVDPQDGSKDALAALFHLAFIYGCKIQRCDDIVIEVNPRHVVFYKRMLGFERAGPERMCERVSAPAVLMRLPGSYAGEQIDRHGGHQTNARSLYPYFFSKREEDGICERLRRMS